MIHPIVFPLPTYDIRWWRSIVFLVGVVMLTGCSTFVSNEKRSVESYVPGSSLSIIFVENPTMLGTLETLVQQGGKVKDWSKQQAQAKRDIPVMLSLARKGLLTVLKPQLEARNLNVAVEASTQSTRARLSIKPTHYFVECGAMSLICQTSITFEVVLADSRFNVPVWSADFKVGALLGMEQTGDVLQDFYRTVLERLVSAKVIL